MLQLNGFRAWITVDHKSLTPYSIDINPAHNVAICWVSSTAGKTFCVTWEDLSTVRDYATSGRVTLDGLTCRGKVIPPSALYNSGKVKKSQIHTSSTSARPFTFGELELTDDDKYLDSSSSQHLGEILLKIHRVHIRGRGVADTLEIPTDQMDGLVHERSKKATTHRVKFGEEYKTRKHGTTFVKDIGTEPVVTFIFKYRPFDVLQANGIVPATPRPVPERANRDLKRNRDKLESDDEVKVLVLEDIKPLACPRTPKEKKVKLETKPRKFGGPVEIIDLT